MNKEQYQKWAQEVLGPLQDTFYMAVDDSGDVVVAQTELHIAGSSPFWHRNCNTRRIGKADLNFPWQESLVRKRRFPEIGQIYFTPNIHSLEYFVELLFQDNSINRLRLERGLIYKTKDEAIARAQRMLATEY
jgi:hypothetical protein